jgi:WD40 repeat protein
VKAICQYTISPDDGSVRLAAGGEGGVLKIYDPVAGLVVHELNVVEGPMDHYRRDILALTSFFSSSGPGSTILVSASADGTAKLWDGTEGTLLHDLGGLVGEVTALAVYREANEGRDRVVIGASDHWIRVFDAETGALVHAMGAHHGAITALIAYESPAGRPLLVSG